MASSTLRQEAGGDVTVNVDIGWLRQDFSKTFSKTITIFSNFHAKIIINMPRYPEDNFFPYGVSSPRRKLSEEFVIIEGRGVSNV